MGGLTPIGAIGLGSSFLEYANYIPIPKQGPLSPTCPGGGQLKSDEFLDLPLPLNELGSVLSVKPPKKVMHILGARLT